MRAFPLTLALALLLLVAAPCSSHAADRYVSTAGSNAGAGTLGSPWRTIDFAADNANPGDTIFVRGGEYRERVTPNRSGTAASRITIKNYADESPVIDGTGQPVGGQTAMVDIGSRSYITFDGFQIRNLVTSTNSQTPIGILVDGASVGIEILNCEIYNIRNDGNNGNAHGMLIQGTSTTPISGLVVRGNELRDLILGNSESLVLNGNVNGFEVCENYVHDCNNLGIDFIGFEGNGPPGQDQARNGVCRDNIVTNISTINNPAYNAYTAGGIYVDGGRDIIIERNRVSHCDIGVEVASEDPNGTTTNVIVRDNLLWHNLMGGIFVGGYNATRGAATNCSIVGNTLIENDTLGNYSGEILVQYNTSNLDIRNNIMYARPNNAFIIVNNGNNSGITLDYNCYYSTSAPNAESSEWIWNGTFHFGFNAYHAASGQDANSVYGNPQLTDKDAADFTIDAGSPARDSGDASYVPGAGQTDAFGNPRIGGSRIDIGAHEFVFVSAFGPWRQLYFGTTENSGDAANGADPESDGLINLLEFAFAGQNPTVADAEGIVRLTSTGLEFSRNPDASAEITYRVFASPDLISWTEIGIRPAAGDWSSVSGVTISESMGKTLVTDARGERGRAHFYRVEVTTP